MSKRKIKKPKRDKNPKWTKFQEARFPPTKNLFGHEVSRENEIVFVNSRYQVCVIENAPNGFGMEGITWLSIRHQARDHRHDWRDFQRIKNELCGRERDAIEIYPAESRLHDTADQFHLWVFPEGSMIPLGFVGRFVSDAPRPGTGSQRKFAEGFGHSDNMDEGELAKLTPHVTLIGAVDVEEIEYDGTECPCCGGSLNIQGVCLDGCQGCESDGS